MAQDQNYIIFEYDMFSGPISYSEYDLQQVVQDTNDRDQINDCLDKILHQKESISFLSHVRIKNYVGTLFFILLIISFILIVSDGDDDSFYSFVIYVLTLLFLNLYIFYKCTMNNAAKFFDQGGNRVIKEIIWNNKNLIVKCRYRKNVNISMLQPESSVEIGFSIDYLV